MAELLDALVVGGVASHKFQPVPQGEGGDHRIGPSNGLADPVEVPGTDYYLAS
jgi:hypothetical protein